MRRICNGFVRQMKDGIDWCRKSAIATYLCLVTLLVLLAACGPKLPPLVPPELLTPPVGYVGATPVTEGQFLKAVVTDKRALGQCTMQLESIREILPS